MDRYPSIRKCSTVGIILLFVTTGIIPSSAKDIVKPSLPTSSGQWLYVGGNGPGNYTTIQDAINKAADGDTIFVFDDSSPYEGTVFVLKSLTIQGENKFTTIIDSGGFVISVSNVTITGFTIQNSDEGVHIGRDGSTASYNIIDNNIFSNVSVGVDINYYDAAQGYNIISNNVITYTKNDGIIINGENNIVTGNNVSQDVNYRDPYYTGSSGIVVGGSFNNVSYNNIHDNSEGVHLSGNRNEIYRNTIKANYDNGMFVYNSFSDRVIQNNFINNRRNARIWRFVEPDQYTSILPVIFDGNYWEEARTLPYPISGLFLYNSDLSVWVLAILFGLNGENWILEYFPSFIRFDWHPAQRPYDIPEMR